MWYIPKDAEGGGPVNTQCGTGVRGQWRGRKGDTESSSTGYLFKYI